MLSICEIPKWDQRVGRRRVRTKIVIWAIFCLNVIEIHSFKTVEKKIQSLFLWLFLQEY